MRFVHAMWPVIAALLTVSGIIGLFGTSNVDAVLDWLGKAVSWIQQRADTQNTLATMLIILGALVYVRYRRYGEMPLVILSTDVQIEVDDYKDNLVTVTRRQIIRARHPKVTAIHTTLTPSFGGEIRKRDVSGGLENDPISLTDELEKFGSLKSGWECLHVIKPSLPFPWYTYFLPDFMIARQPWEHRSRFIRRCAVQRRMKVVYFDPVGPDSGEQYYLLSADRYLQRNITLTFTLPLRFLDEDEVRDKKVASAKLIANAAVEDLPITWKKNEGGRVVGTVHVAKIQNSKVGIFWNLTPAD